MRPSHIGYVTQHVKSDGEAKIGYPTREAARAAQPSQVAYLCSLCERWHCSSPKRKRARS